MPHGITTELIIKYIPFQYGLAGAHSIPTLRISRKTQGEITISDLENHKKVEQTFLIYDRRGILPEAEHLGKYVNISA